MVASQAVGDDIAGKERQQRSPATGGLDVASGNADQALEPDLPIVGELGTQTVGSHQRMRESPHLTMELAQGLRTPASQRQVVELPEGPRVLFPESVQR